MKCLRCGYCCIHYEVIIIADPAKPLSADNIQAKPSGQRCPHLVGNAAGSYSCAVHDHPDYEQTPCFDFTQVEASPDDPCRMGVYILKRDNADTP